LNFEKIPNGIEPTDKIQNVFELEPPKKMQNVFELRTFNPKGI